MANHEHPCRYCGEDMRLMMPSIRSHEEYCREEIERLAKKVEGYDMDAAAALRARLKETPR